MLSQKYIPTVASPEENCPPIRVGFSVKVRVSFRVGGNPEENCPLYRVKVWVRVSFGVRGRFSSGAIVLEPYMNKYMSIY